MEGRQDCRRVLERDDCLAKSCLGQPATASDVSSRAALCRASFATEAIGTESLWYIVGAPLLLHKTVARPVHTYRSTMGGAGDGFSEMLTCYF